MSKKPQPTTALTTEKPPRERPSECWKKIGVHGDNTCIELEEFIHCHNCPIFADAGRVLFQRKGNPAYLEEWRCVLATVTESKEKSDQSAVVFKVSGEWLAISSQFINEIHDVRSIHKVPHLSGKVFLGIAGIRGRLRLCFSMKGLLEIGTHSNNPDYSTEKASGQARMICMEGNQGSWVFTADDIHDVVRFSLDKIQPAPATVAKSSKSFCRGLIEIDGKSVELLDEELVFHHLRKVTAQ